MSNSKHYIWSAINRVGVQLIGFIGNVFIARILSPDDYGLVAMLSIVIGISWNFIDSGFADYLIRKPEADKKDFGVVLSHNVFVSIVFFIILYFTSPLIADFFGRIELIEITILLALSVIIRALTITELTRMRKELEFKKFAIIQITSSILSIIVAYYFAVLGFGYYALVAQTLSLAVFNALLLMLMNKWLPHFCFDWTRYKKMRRFGNDMLFSYFTNQIGQNLYSVFIGKFQSSISLGYFNQANKVNDASFQGLNSILLTTSYPIIAKEKDKAKRREKYVSLTNSFLYIHFFLSFLIIGCSNELITVVFSEKWSSTGPYLQLITLSTLFFPLLTINANIVKTENETGIYRNLTFLRNGLTLISLLLTFQYSMTAILIGLIIARYISVFTDMLYCGKKIDFGFAQQVKIIAFQMIAPLMAMGIAYLLANNFEKNITKLLLFSVIYGIVFLVFNKTIRNKIQEKLFQRIFAYLKIKL